MQPPAKKARLSPNSATSPSAFAPPLQSPYASSPSLQHVALPNAYTQSRSNPANGVSPTANQAAVGTMGPPQRPAEKPPEPKEEPPEKHLDVNELADLVTSSGVDLRQEEEFMAASYRNERYYQSFDSTRSAQTSPQTSFDLLNGSFGALGNHGTLSRQPQPTMTAEEELNEKHRQAARKVNESQSKHLQNSFLLGNAMQTRMNAIAKREEVKMPQDGLFHRTVQEARNNMARGADGSSIQALQAPSILNRGSSLEPILSLISLAASERIRGLVEDAYGICRGRQTSADGVVPPDWADIAEGPAGAGSEATKVVPVSVTRSSWDRPSDSEAPETQQATLTKEQETVSFPPKVNPFVESLHEYAGKDRKAEEARVKRRRERKAKKADATVAAATSGTATPNASANTPNGTSTPTTPGLIGDIAPEKPMTKKEREKAAKAEITDEVALRNANAAATMALGGRKRYSWQTAGVQGGLAKSSPLANRFAATAAAANAGAAGKSGIAPAVGRDGLPASSTDRRFGIWREDGPGGKNVQMHDWINVLEADGHEVKTLSLAMSKVDPDANEVNRPQRPGLGRT